MDHPVDLALNGQLAPGLLTEAEQEAYLDRVEESLLQPSEFETQFFALRRSRGVGVGLDDDGQLVHQAPEV